MKCGVVFQPTNFGDWGRFNAERWDEPPTTPDHAIWDRIIHFVELVDSLGFDKIWSTEHRATPYGMIPNPLQFLAFVAGRTKNVGVGTQVIVVPWWQSPVRAAEEIALLDNFLRGRAFTVGFGRGVAKREFDAMGIDRNESRGRFSEGIELIRLALSQERFSFDGEYFKVTDASIRPHPRDRKALVDGMVAAFSGPESLEAAANLGVGMITITGKGVDVLSGDVTQFNAIRAQNGLPPTQPIIQVICYVAETEQKAEESASWFADFETEVNLHYEFKNVDEFKGIKGYERYLENAEKKLSSHFEGRDDLLIVGTPDRVVQRLQAVQEKTSAREFVLHMVLPTQPTEAAERSIRLFANEVLPAVREMEPVLHDEHKAAVLA